MKKETISKWLQQLESKRILTRSVRNNTTFFHLETPAEFNYPPILIGEIQRNYDSKFEKGGYILFEPTIVNEKVILTATEIVWIKNISETPERSYRIATTAHNDTEQEALSRMLLPLRFHTHPTHSLSIVQSQVNFLYQLGTSDADKRCSFLDINTCGIKLILPDQLIVGKQMESSVFIGIYNGLITPLDFEKHKRLVQSKQVERVGNGLVEWLKNDNNKIWAGFGLLAVIFMCFRYPKGILPTMGTIGIVAQDLSMKFKADDCYFGIAIKSNHFKISVPEVTADILEDNEKILASIKSAQTK